MASIERTAYPRFKSSLTVNELHTLYCPTDDELAFISTHARGDAQQLTLLTLLKCHQYLGYLPALADVIDETIQTPPEDNAALGQGVRNILKDYGGAEALRERYEQVAAYHNNNYRPLMWGFYSPYRSELFRLSHLLTFRSATQDQSLEWLHFTGHLDTRETSERVRSVQ